MSQHKPDTHSSYRWTITILSQTVTEKNQLIKNMRMNRLNESLYLLLLLYVKFSMSTIHRGCYLWGMLVYNA